MQRELHVCLYLQLTKLNMLYIRSKYSTKSFLCLTLKKWKKIYVEKKWIENNFVEILLVRSFSLKSLNFHDVYCCSMFYSLFAYLYCVVSCCKQINICSMSQVSPTFFSLRYILCALLCLIFFLSLSFLSGFPYIVYLKDFIFPLFFFCSFCSNLINWKRIFSSYPPSFARIC